MLCHPPQVEQEIETLLGRQRNLLDIKEKLSEQIAADQRAPRADWQSQFSWDGQVQGVLEETFKLTNFRYCAHCSIQLSITPAFKFAVNFHAITFGISVLMCLACRPHQHEIINATLQGRDVLCLMPTGKIA